MIHASTVAAILLMALATYATRVGGALLLRNRTLGPRARAVLEAAPGCVLISVIAPAFVSDSPADLIALALTLAAAIRLPILPTVLIGIASAGILRHLIA
ncbi:MAG: AzlD family protein [Telmatospirillum sp.]|nr:AzlD family protein [Telmatospirillum sp.]